jgi:ATP-binding cassette subfamily C protein LapB
VKSSSADRARLSGIRPLLKSVHPLTVAVLFVASAALVTLSFAVPLTALQVYDRIIAYGSRSTLAWLALGCLAALLLEASLQHGRSCLCAWSAARYTMAMDRRLAETILAASPETVASEDAARHLERFRGLSGAAGTVLARFLPVVAEAPFALAYFAVLEAVGGRVVIVPACAAVAELALALALRPRYLSINESAAEAERNRAGYIGFALKRIHFIKAQALEQPALGVFEREQSASTAALARRMGLNRFMDEFGRIVSGATSFGIMLWGGSLVSSGVLTFGAVSASLFFSSRFVGIARDLRRGLFLIADARESLKEQYRGLDLQPRSGAGDPPLPSGVEGRLEFVDVQYGKEESQEVAGLSFILRPGEAVLVRGANKFVRSAICRLAAGIVGPDRGLVLLDAYPSSRWDFRDSPGTVGYVSGGSSVLPGSLLDNIASFDPGQRDMALDISQVLGLDRIVSRLPRGFETSIGPGDQGGLSRSSIRLVTLARALARRPRILVWDEADADLDAAAAERCRSLLADLHGSMSLLLNARSAAFRNLASAAIGPAVEEQP